MYDHDVYIYLYPTMSVVNLWFHVSERKASAIWSLGYTSNQDFNLIAYLLSRNINHIDSTHVV